MGLGAFDGKEKNATVVIARAIVVLSCSNVCSSIVVNSGKDQRILPLYKINFYEPPYERFLNSPIIFVVYHYFLADHLLP